MTQFEMLIARVNNIPLGNGEVVASLRETFCWTWCRRPFDLNRDFELPSSFQQQVNFGARMGAIKVRHPAGASSQYQILNAKSFEARAADRMAEQVIQAFKLEKAVQNSAVSHVDFGSPNQAFANVSAPRAKAPKELQVDEQVDVPFYRWIGDSQCAGDSRLVENASLLMGEHGPKPANCLGGQAWRKHWNVPLQVTANEVSAPIKALGIIRCKQAIRETAAQPECAVGDSWCGNFFNIERRNVKVRHSSGEGFARLAHQVERGRSEQQELPASVASLPIVINDATQNFKNTRRAMDLVNYDQLAILRPDVPIGIIKPKPIRRPFKIQIHRATRPVSCQGSRQRCFPNLTGAQQDDSGCCRQLCAQDGFSLSWDHMDILTYNVTFSMLIHGTLPMSQAARITRGGKTNLWLIPI